MFFTQRVEPGNSPKQPRYNSTRGGVGLGFACSLRWLSASGPRLYFDYSPSKVRNTASPEFIRLQLVLYVEISEGLKQTIQYSQEESKITPVLAIKG